MELTEWAKLQEELFKAQLGVIRGYSETGAQWDAKEGRPLSVSHR